MLHFIRYVLPAYMGLAAIFVVSAIPSNKLPSPVIQLSDKFLHLFVYLILGILLRRAFAFSRNTKFQVHALELALISGILWGISDELHQWFVPGRLADLYDVLADAIGVALAQPIFNLLYRIRRNRSHTL
ncbi:MAG: hypothetical protein B6244_06970 [Candidatus Cloacimonetes bacterium 4572_55]|nr:MAG: hypothetical protein B6244_06970 [Candidatus Cloacimonetes bacterium 4572_55]